ncbi:MAG TPA: SDR family oxidoreductase [Fodinibius sp.]|nr:SDR family oxidoreductase [Fodinibius sp.]
MNSDAALRKAVVTGGSSGIGKSIIHAFSKAGIVTAAADVNADEDLPGDLFKIDLTDPKQITAFISNVKNTIGFPDILICNAGRGIHQKLSEGDPDRWEKIFQLNVFSTFRLIRAFVPAMIMRAAGDVVFISSVSSGHAYTYGGIYTATKAAIDQLAETLRLEVQPDIRVTVIHPGVVETDFFKSMISGNQTPEEIGWGALHPDRVAEAVLYAVSQPREVMVNDLVIRPIAQPM